MRFKELVFSKATIPALLAGVAGVLVVLYAWQLPPFTSSVQSTNNAYVKGQVTILAPQLAGYVVQVPVTDYLEVRKGDLLVQLDDRIYQQQLAQAKATLAQQKSALANYDANYAAKQSSVELAQAQLTSADAALEKAQRDAGRNSSLLKSGIAAQSSADQANAALAQAEAGVTQGKASVAIAEQNLALVEAGKPGLEAAVQGAEAAVHLAEINLSNTRIVAPVDGRLGEVTARIGQFVSVGTQLTSVTPEKTWVIANFKETQLANIEIGQEASFTVDALNAGKLVGHISEISPAAGSEFSVLKPDNATGNFTKVAQRIPVRIEIDPGQPLAQRLLPGMSVEVSVDTAVTRS
ncbi:HlyD family secretion protein [Paradevosia shaoguanensis]|uniref:HlyD family secretion protein n=1 Tax=Paradevosia shaoguanensis TaxID=1335043 RepID=A0AA41QM65_9HYPH|nr:HlyD family secretion protein [Paradevosia shaoguanensis]MCF1742239.1 HlyD family secretion protein [Paradevosia shaoguanensis]MCI0126722.1 HlyD family secretion protein [Paradevosia shaoguanensis]